jgi:hypothetical protein
MAEMTAILKNYYLGPIREQLNNSKVLYANIKKSSKEVVGEQVVIPLRKGRNWGVGARGSLGTGTLPTASSQKYKKSYFPTKDIYGRIGISGKTIRATKSDKGAFLRIVQSETKGCVDDVGNDINRQMFGDTTGTLTTAGTGTTSATVPVASSQYLEEGMIIDFNAGGSGSSTGIVIQSIDSETQITTATTATWTTSDPITITGVVSGAELNGLSLITASTGALQGLNPASAGESFWAGVVYGSDGSPIAITEDRMQEIQDKIEENGGKVSMIVGHFAARRAYSRLLTALKRYTPPAVGKLKGGFDSLDFNNIPVTVDRQSQRTTATTRFYFLSGESLGLYRMADFDWMQEDGAILARQTGASATETYEATLVCDMEFGTDCRRHNGQLIGITP